MTRARRRLSGDSGAEAVEFALVVPLLLILVFGLIDYGLLFNSQTIVGNSAREGARMWSLGGTLGQVNTAVVSSTGSLVGPTSNVRIAYTCTKPDGTNGSPCWSNGTTQSVGAADKSSTATSNVVAGGTVTITVKADYNWLTPLQVFIPGNKGGPMTITRSSTMRVE